MRFLAIAFAQFMSIAYFLKEFYTTRPNLRNVKNDLLRKQTLCTVLLPLFTFFLIGI